MNVIFLVLLLNASLAGIEEAKRFAQAQDYDQAEVLYNRVLARGVPAWQQNILYYDLGTVFLQKGDYSQALHNFQKVMLEESSPLLKRDLYTNMSAASFSYAKKLDENMTYENEKKREHLLRIASIYVNEAIKADCALTKMSGEKTCRAPSELVDLEREIKILLNEVLLKIDSLAPENISVSMSLFLLLSANQAGIDSVEFLQKMESNALKMEYKNYFAGELKTWLPLWNKTPFSKERVHFENGLLSMRQGDLSKSLEWFKEVEKGLRENVEAVFGKHPNAQLLTKLLVSYQSALAQAPLQQSALYALYLQQDQIARLLKENFLNQSTDDLKKSLESLQKGSFLLSRLYLMEAEQIIKRAIERQKKEMPPNEALSNVIQEQTHALAQNRLFGESVKKEGAIILLRESQGTVVKTAGSFLDLVYKTQENAFKKECQRYPWTSVLPLFNEGLLKAQKALNLLEQSKEGADLYQEEALNLWKKALAVLEQKEKEALSQEQEAEEQDEIDAVLRRLQRMERDDRAPKKQMRAGGVERPW